MAINIRRVGEVADGSVTADKLAAGAVDLSTDRVTGALPTVKLADSAVTEGKLADDAVSTNKIVDDAVTLDKAVDDIKSTTFIGDETEVSVTGTGLDAVKIFNFPVNTQLIPKKLRFIGSLKTSATHIATMEVWINDALAPELDPLADPAGSPLISSSIEYEVKDVEIDISTLTAGTHTCTIKLKSDTEGGIASNNMVDILLVK